VGIEAVTIPVIYLSGTILHRRRIALRILPVRDKEEPLTRMEIFLRLFLFLLIVIATITIYCVLAILLHDVGVSGAGMLAPLPICGAVLLGFSELISRLRINK
jgi:hypothetical protein